MSAASSLLARQKDQKVHRATARSDLAMLLAALSVRQDASETARRVREGNPPDFAGDEPARMAVIFAPALTAMALPQGSAGAFNVAVAARLAMGRDGESCVYFGT